MSFTNSVYRGFVPQPFRRETGDGATVFTKGGTIYKLEGVLGVGGLSVVYVATRFSDKLTVALKLPNANAKSNAEAINLLRREARILNRLDHPNIVKVIEEGETTNGEPFLAMDLVRAQTLDVLMTANGGRLSIERASNICLQVCDALAHAHARGIIHRDLKPANVFVRTINGVDQATLFDFGIASVDGDESEVGDCGSLLYVSPEQLTNRPCTPRSDVYQMALIFFESCAGRLPFDRDVFPAVQYRHGELPILPENEELPGRALPQSFRDVLAEALSPEPECRPASMDMFAYKLRQVLTKLRLIKLRFGGEQQKITA
jgi:serine/threonine-protein kinase